jgi:type IV pilus assembly protein PilV
VYLIMKKRHSRKTPLGMALIEVLVSAVLFSIGILGLLAVHARSAQYSGDSEDRTRAALLASELASSMWAQNSVSLDATTVSSWQTAVSNTSSGGLPNGSGSVAVNGSIATITITWQAPWKSSSETNRYVTQIDIP